MKRLFSRYTICFLCLFTWISAFSDEENFLLLNGITNEKMIEFGPRVRERVSPCSTFKIALSLMGFDVGILEDAETPIWDFQPGYDSFLDSWKTSQTPQTWMKTSCVWYSRILATFLGLENMQDYLADFEYGNQDMSGGMTRAWLSSSLKISPEEQAHFLQRMVRDKLSVSSTAVEQTKALLFVDELPGGWKLFGKTGWSGSSIDLEIGWFVGWVEKGQAVFPFAYNIREKKINLAQRIPRVKQLLSESKVMTGLLYD